MFPSYDVYIDNGIATVTEPWADSEPVLDADAVLTVEDAGATIQYRNGARPIGNPVVILNDDMAIPVVGNDDGSVEVALGMGLSMQVEW